MSNAVLDGSLLMVEDFPRRTATYRRMSVVSALWRTNC